MAKTYEGHQAHSETLGADGLKKASICDDLPTFAEAFAKQLIAEWARTVALNISMTPIALADCPSLIDFLLAADDVGPTVTFNGTACVVERIDGQHAHFEFIGPAFGCSVVAPGWYVGEHGMPLHVLIVGDTEACLRWMPIDPTDKRALIERLPLDQIDKTVLKLSV